MENIASEKTAGHEKKNVYRGVKAKKKKTEKKKKS